MGWGTAFLDTDNDGWLDLVPVNGHVFPEVYGLENADLSNREASVLYQNLAGKRFADISLASGPGICEQRAVRGLRSPTSTTTGGPRP